MVQGIEGDHNKILVSVINDLIDFNITSDVASIEKMEG